MSGYEYGRESENYERYDGDGYEGDRYERDRYDDDRRDRYEETTYTETDTYSSGDGRGYGRPPSPRVPHPWRARWDEREQRYFFEHEETRERVWSVEEVEARLRGGGESFYEQTDEYSSGPRYGRGYGGEDQVYQSEEVIEERRRSGEHHGHGLEYGLAGAGVGAGAFAMYEGEKIHRHYEDDKYRVENFENRVEDDVVHAPEHAAGWVGRKVGDVERFGDDVRYSYDEGRDDARYGTDY